MWADLNAAGTFKFSDADFPVFLGWNCFGDDTSTADQRCDSAKLKTLLTSEIDDPAAKQVALTDPIQMFSYTRNIRIKPKLRRAICKFPTEFDQGNFEARYGHIKETEYFRDDTTGKSWNLLSDHIKALTKTDLPQKYKDAQWHLHPVEFVEVMRKCGWLSGNELLRCMPYKYQANSGNKNTPIRLYTLTTNDARRRLEIRGNIQFMHACRKYGIVTGKRLAHFLSQIYQETGILRLVEEVASGQEYEGRRDLGNTQAGDGVRFKGRGYIQVTGRANYDKYSDYRGRRSEDKYTSGMNNLILSTSAFEISDTAGLYWISRSIGSGSININKKADNGTSDSDLRAVTKNVNGAEDGLWTGLVARRSHLTVLCFVLLDGVLALTPESERRDVL